MALAFVQRFPIGSELSSADLGVWAEQQGLLTVPSSKSDPTWLGYIQARGQVRDHIRKAGTHPRINDEGGIPFTLEAVGREHWRVIQASDAIRRADPIGAAESLLATKKKQFQYLCQGANLQLSPMLQYLANEMHHDIESAERDIHQRSLEVLSRANRTQALIEVELRRLAISDQSGRPDHPTEEEC
jgi:hypothetical protein